MGEIIALAAASVQHGLGSQGHDYGLQGFNNGPIEAAVQKLLPGGNLIPGVAGVAGVLAVHGQQIHIALPGNIKAVAAAALPAVFQPGQGLSADGTQKLHAVASILTLYSTVF